MDFDTSRGNGSIWEKRKRATTFKANHQYFHIIPKNKNWSIPFFLFDKEKEKSTKNSLKEMSLIGPSKDVWFTGVLF